MNLNVPYLVCYQPLDLLCQDPSAAVVDSRTNTEVAVAVVVDLHFQAVVVVASKPAAAAAASSDAAATYETASAAAADSYQAY